MYEAGVPPGDAIHVSSTVEPVTVATSPAGAEGGAIVSNACSRPDSACHETRGALHTGLAAALPKTPRAAELVKQLHDRTGASVA